MAKRLTWSEGGSGERRQDVQVVRWQWRAELGQEGLWEGPGWRGPRGGDVTDAFPVKSVAFVLTLFVLLAWWLGILYLAAHSTGHGHPEPGPQIYAMAPAPQAVRP